MASCQPFEKEVDDFHVPGIYENAVNAGSFIFLSLYVYLI